MKKIIRIAALLAAASLHAQESPKKPAPPFIAESMDPITITRVFSLVHPPQPNAKTKGMLERSVTEIHPPVWHITQTRIDDPGACELWLCDGKLIGENLQSPGQFFVAHGLGNGSGGGSDFSSYYPEARWVDEKNFVKWETLDGRRCRVHSDTVPPHFISEMDHSIDYDFPFGLITAWIDDATRRPIQVRTRDFIIRLSYASGPSDPLTVPPKVAAYIHYLRMCASGKMR